MFSPTIHNNANNCFSSSCNGLISPNCSFYALMMRWLRQLLGTRLISDRFQSKTLTLLSCGCFSDAVSLLFGPGTHSVVHTPNWIQHCHGSGPPPHEVPLGFTIYFAHFLWFASLLGTKSLGSRCLRVCLPCPRSQIHLRLHSHTFKTSFRTCHPTVPFPKRI